MRGIDRDMCTRRPNTVVFVGLLFSLVVAAVAGAADVRVVAVTPGRSVAVQVGHGSPTVLEVGETVDGVTLVRTDGDAAILRVDGVTSRYSLEAVQSGASSYAGGARSVRLKADARGHYVTRGKVNGRSVEFMVDTGASLTTLSTAHAKRIGLRYRRGAPARASTANGMVQGWSVQLDSVRVGSVTVHDVDAMVIDTPLQVALLGMSFLDRFDMEQKGSTLVLRRR